MENKNNNFIGNQNQLSSSGSEQGVPILQKPKKPKLRWKTGLLVLFFSFYYFDTLYLIDTIEDIEDIYDIGISIAPVVFVFLIYIFTAYRAEKVVSNNKLTWGWIVRYNLLLSLIIYIPTLLIMFFLLALSSAFGSSGSSDNFKNTIVETVWTIGFIIIIFSIVPTVILKKYRNSKKFIPILLVSFAVFFSLSAGYKYIGEETCDYNRNVECFVERARFKKNAALCDVIKEERKRNSCYTKTFYRKSLNKDDVVMCDGIKNDGIRDSCYESIVSDIKKTLENKDTIRQICGKIKEKGETADECYVGLSRLENSTKICEKISLSFNKSECIANVAVNSKDKTLCERSFSGKEEISYCYTKMSMTRKWEDISICDKTVSGDKYYCKVYILMNFSDIPSCKEAKEKNYSHLMSKCVADYNQTR